MSYRNMEMLRALQFRPTGYKRAEAAIPEVLAVVEEDKIPACKSFNYQDEYTLSVVLRVSTMCHPSVDDRYVREDMEAQMHHLIYRDVYEKALQILIKAEQSDFTNRGQDWFNDLEQLVGDLRT